MAFKDLMIDLETLATTADAVVLSIGAVPFDLETGKVSESGYYHAVSIDSNLELGRRISGDTLQWWMKQSPAAQAVFHEPTIHLSSAMEGLDQFIGQNKYRPWSNGADFDLPMLSHIYAQLGMKPPWAHWNSRCMRTYKNLPGADKVVHEFVGTAHNALADAHNQAVHVCAIHKAIFKGKK